jgi:polyisoprenoid-binding protein YceI
VDEVEKFLLVPDESAVLIEARSNVGPISFATTTLEGEAVIGMTGPDVDDVAPVSAVIRIPVLSLESGNSLYDAELRSRLDQRRFPLITVELYSARPLGTGRFSAEGDVTIHGATQRLTGSVMLTMPDENTLVAYGLELIDIRDFAIEVPNVLMLKIYPDVGVQFRLTAKRG